MKNFKILTMISLLMSSFVIPSDSKSFSISNKTFKLASALGRYIGQQSGNPDVITFEDVNKVYAILHGQPLNVSAEEQQFLVGYVQAAVDAQKDFNLSNATEKSVIALEHDLQDYLSANNMKFVQKDLVETLFAQGKRKIELSDIQSVLQNDGSSQAQQVSRAIKRMNSSVKKKLVAHVNDILTFLRLRAQNSKNEENAKQKTLNDYNETLENLHNMYDGTYSRIAKEEQRKIITNLAEVLKALQVTMRNQSDNK